MQRTHPGRPAKYSSFAKSRPQIPHIISRQQVQSSQPLSKHNYQVHQSGVYLRTMGPSLLPTRPGANRRRDERASTAKMDTRERQVSSDDIFNEFLASCREMRPDSAIEHTLKSFLKAKEVVFWQEVPQIWDSVRSDLDSHPGYGRYILTGSSVPRREEYIHSGTGRIAKLRMRTMTLYETGDSDGSVSLRELMFGKLEMSEKRDVELEQLVDFVVRGGWPAALGVDPEDYGLIPREYIESAIEDACRLDGKQRDREKMTMLIKSLSRNESTVVSNETVKNDMRSYDDESISNDTYYDYSDCLDRIHLLEDTPSFKANFRSNVRIGKKPKRHLTDVSLAVAALGLNHKKLMGDLNTFGFMFESLCEHDLQIYAEHRGGRLFHYRDGRGREIDAVVETDDRRWGAFEIELGAGQIDDAAENLLKMNDFFNKEGCPPSLLCVICGMTTYAYRRPDGVRVIPITSLGP